MADIITRALVSLDTPIGASKEEVIRSLAERVVAQGRATDATDLARNALEREAQAATGMPGGIAIPHCRSKAVTEATLAMARLKPTVDFGATDGGADLVFFIAVPDGADQAHLVLLAKLARSLIKDEFVAALRAAETPDDIVRLVDEAVADEPAAAPAAPAAPAGKPSIVAVTACPTGIAHTYMAADALVAAGKRAGVDVHVETQGSSSVTPLDPALIASAGAVIFAVDVDVRDKGRFGGKPLVQGPVKRGVDEPDAMIADAIAASTDPNPRRVPTGGETGAESSGIGESMGAKVKRVLLTGVSYMIPFVAGGGLLIALGFLFGGYRITDDAATIIVENNFGNLPEGGLLAYLGAVFFMIGSTSMGFLVPALAGYIAYAIADRPGIAPGFVAGAVAGLMGAGFIGGLVGGVLAGLAAYWLGTLSVPRWLRGLMPVVIIPLLGSIFASGLLIMVLGGPIAALSTGLNDWLNSLTGASAILLGVILGAMMSFDLGGPVNKVAYSFAVAGLGAGSLENQTPWMIMGAVMAAGMVAPLGLALASTVLARGLFTPVERENGKAAWLLGASFISEGAIPFAAVDPLRVIPSAIVGGSVTGALCMAFGVYSQAPHGGVFVFFAIGNFPLFVLSIVIGAVVMALTVIALKRWVRKAPATAETPESAKVAVAV
ncbi:fructose-specific PTS transporter subunit EIIC [Conyzicola nivalis]|uniref:PTS lactose transporter subunit IIC n=1 Tax=Conyzicola nivalis TaxID=1477021 RepID=A0A916WEV1_9MICO|nr:fructose-specific PTS transporter subunit EIIC [Conyzicola nivalis]GGA91354.1 PTS lactose transporter subunit IIC [Conyzicola nivalis]